MNLEPKGIFDTIQAIDPDQVSSANATARRLRGAGLDVQIRPMTATSSDWYLGANFAFRPASHQRAPIGAPAEALARVLAEHEALLAQVETSTGYAAEFGDFGAPPVDAVVISLARDDEDVGELIVKAGIEETPQSSPPEVLALDLIVARLALPDAEAIAGGDMVILSRGPWPITSLPTAISAAELSFCPDTGQLATAFPIQSHSQETHPMADAENRKELSIPVTMRLADVMITPSELSEINAGGVLKLNAVAEGLSVTLSVGGRSIGRGEIVRIGDRYGVVLEEPAASEEPASPAEGEIDLSSTQPGEAE